MSTIPFQVSARTARLIGRENVSNAEAALIELIKNSYDADATESRICFKGDDLYILDNGQGMAEKTIRDYWMVIGTNNKDVQPLTSKGRVKSGAKGIGRFALDKLGRSASMYTKTSSGEEGVVWSVEWDAFEQSSKTVNEIEATIDSLSSDLFVSMGQKLGIDSLDSGTIFHIRGLREKWTQKALDRLYQSLESLVPTIEQDTFNIELRADTFPDAYGKVDPLITSDFDYALTAIYSHKTKNLNVEIKRNELDVSRLQKKFGSVFEEPEMRPPQYNVETFNKGSYELEIPLISIMKGFKDAEGHLDTFGDFSAQIIFAKNLEPNGEDRARFPYKSVDYDKRKKWMQKFGGIRIYRDNFRVRPYGENGEDWLRLGERQAQSPQGVAQRLGGYKVRPNQVTGSIYISRLDNHELQDKSSREGIVENDSFELLKNLIRGILSLLEEDRNTVFYSLGQLYKKTNEIELAKARGHEALVKVRKKIEEKRGKESGKDWQWAEKEEAEAVIDYFGIMEMEGHDKDEEIKILRSLASSGLITAAAAHELKGFRNHIKIRNQQLREIMAKYVKEEDLSGVRSAFNPYVRLDQMKQADEGIAGWLDYALMPLKRDKRSRKTFNLTAYFNDFSSMWLSLLETRGIAFHSAIVEPTLAIRMFPIDLDTIFNNLVINSIESFSRQSNGERLISVSANRRDDIVVIDYTDNGVGLDKSLRDDPYKIFRPHVTTKVDNLGEPIGTGMGMYLIKSVIDENGGTIELSAQNEGFGVHIELKGLMS